MQTKNSNVENLRQLEEFLGKMGQLDQLVFVGGAPPLPPRVAPLVFSPISPANLTSGFYAPESASLGPYKPVPPPRPLAGGGRPPAPPTPAEPPLPGAAPAHHGETLHTHSSKFPIEREVVLSTLDKNSKIPLLQEYRRRQQNKGAAVAPDTPRRTQAAWTVDMQNQQGQAGTSGEGFRQGGINRTLQDPNNASNPPVPLKQTFIYGTRADSKYEDPPNGSSVSISVDTSKDGTKESKSTSKTMTKTYHTLKDMISSRFKGKDNSETETKSVEVEAGLNNVTEELRKSIRDRAEQEAALNASRDVGRKTAGEQGIYGRPVPQQRVTPIDLQYGGRQMMQNHQMPAQYQGQMQQFNQIGGPSSSPMMNQQQFLQQQMMMNQQHYLGHGPNASSTPQHGLVQARSQELLVRQSMAPEVLPRPHSQIVQQLGATDSIYYQPQYGVAGTSQQRTRPANYPGDLQQPNSGFGIKQAINSQMENDRAIDARSPQQLEREILRQRGLADNRRPPSQPQLDEEHNDQRNERISPSTPTAVVKATPIRRGSNGNLIESNPNPSEQEKDSDDGGFRNRLNGPGRSFDSKDRISNNSTPHNGRQDVRSEQVDGGKSEGMYGGIKSQGYNGISQKSLRQIENAEEATSVMISKKMNPGSTASSDYDKNGGPSSNVDSGRGSAAYSSGRLMGHDTSTESDPLPGSRSRVAASEQAGAGNKLYHEKNGHVGESEWVDIVESELRQILDPKLRGPEGGSAGAGGGGSESVSSVTPPLPPLSPTPSTPEATPRNSARFKHQSLPYGSKQEYGAESRTVLPNQRAGWQHTGAHKHRSSSSKKQEHSQYKKHMFGLDNTDITSTTTRSLDLSSMLDGQSDSEESTQDARAIRRQLQGLENMYCEVLKLLGVRKPPNNSLGKYQPSSEARMVKSRRYGSVSSLPSSSVSSRPVRDKRRNASDQRKKVNDIKGINKRFQRLESHVVTLARSVAHLSSEMRTQHLMIQEMENIRGEITALRNQQRSQSMPRMDNTFCSGNNGFTGLDSSSLANPNRVKKLTKFFGDEPPLLRMFLKKLGYEKYAPLLENERVGAAELPFLGEERLRALGVPLGPRLRIMHEARLALPMNTTSHTTLCIV